MTNVSEIDNPNFLFHHCETIPYLHDAVDEHQKRNPHICIEAQLPNLAYGIVLCCH